MNYFLMLGLGACIGYAVAGTYHAYLDYKLRETKHELFDEACDQLAEHYRNKEKRLVGILANKELKIKEQDERIKEMQRAIDSIVEKNFLDVGDNFEEGEEVFGGF